MIERSPREAAGDEYDLIVVGGGIHGAALTLEAARRGLRPLLLERQDFGGATSWNSLRILHGGLRYLQKLDLGRYRQSVAERHWFMRNFPDQVVPLPCLMPLYGHGLRRPAVFGLAFGLDALLSRGRNRGLAPDRALKRGRVLSPAETLRLFPTLQTRGLLGGALWNDGLMPEAPRVLIEMLRWAVASGGRALNYVEAMDLEVAGGRVVAVRARDVESGDELEFRTPRVVNCAGPWSREVASRFDRDLEELFRPTLAFNLLLDRTPPARVATAVSPPGQSRSYFLVPWRDRLMAGTYYTVTEPERAGLSADDPTVEEFLADLNRAAPELGLTPRDVLRVLWGRLPVARKAPPDPSSRDVLVRHDGVRGLLSLCGVKYTTARAVAEEALTMLFDPASLPNRSGGSARPAPATWPTPEELQSEGAREETAGRLERLAREESVVHLEDLLLRRTDLGLDPTRGRAAAKAVSGLLTGRGARLLGLEASDPGEGSEVTG